MPSPSQHLIIGVDVDGVVADLVGSLIKLVHQRTGHLIAEEQIYSFDLRHTMGDLWTTAQQALSEPGFVRSLSPYPGAIEGIDLLRNIGRVVFVTSPYSQSPTWSYERFRWLQTHAHASERDIVHVDDKTLFGGHLLIDDAPYQLEAWVKTGRPAIRVDRPWNQGAPGASAHNWTDIVALTHAALDQISTTPPVISGRKRE